MALPSGYKQVEYIRSSGTQWINSGIAFSSSNYNRIKLELDVEFDNASGAYEVAGTGTTGSNCLYIGNYNGQVVYGDGKTDRTTGKSVSGRAVYAIDTRNKIVSATGISNISFTPQSPSVSLNLLVLAFNRTSGNPTGHGAKLYGCKIYTSGVLTRDFIPCINPSNVIGVYDDVNGAFYSNAGSGTFTAGEVINSFALASQENVGGVLKSHIEAYENVGGVLKKILYGYQNVGGVLVPLGTSIPLTVWKKYTSSPVGGYEQYEGEQAQFGSGYYNASKSYTFDAQTGQFAKSGEEMRIGFVGYSGSWQTYPYFTRDGSDQIYRAASYSGSVIYARPLLARQMPGGGTYIEDVMSTDSNALPDNGMHTDGYWYIKQ